MKSALLNIDIQDPWALNNRMTTSMIEEFTVKARAHMPVIWACIHWMNRPQPFQVKDMYGIAGAFNKANKHPVLSLHDEDWIQCKQGMNAFHETYLYRLLDRLEIERLYLTGYKTTECVLGTAWGSVKHYDTVLLRDLTADMYEDIPPTESEFDDFRRYGVKVMDSSSLNL